MLALVAGAAAAFVRTQTLKVERPAVRLVRADPRLSPGCACPRSRSRLRFEAREPATVGVFVVDEGDEEVASLGPPVRRQPGRFALVWHGRGGGSEPLPPGDYRVRLELPEEGRSVTFEDRITLDRSVGTGR